MRLRAAAILVGLAAALCGQAAEVALSLRENPRGGRSLLMALETPQGVDALEIRVDRDAAKEAQLGFGPAGWNLEVEGSTLALSGPPLAQDRARFRLDLSDGKLDEKLKVELRAGGKKRFSGQAVVAPAPAAVTRDSLDGLLYPPAVITPGETVRLKPLDEGATPADGRWELGGVEARRNDDELEWVVPSTLAGDATIRIVYHDPWGETLLDAEKTLRADPNLFEGESPRITNCLPEAQIGGALAVCGHFPGESGAGLLLDGRAVEELLSRSLRVAVLRLPPDTTPGTHVISGDPQRGFAPSDQVIFDALRLAGSMEEQSLSGTESTKLRFTVSGSLKPRRIRVRNYSTDLVALEGGETQVIETSGGADNFAVGTLRKIRFVPGRQLGFRLTFELLLEPSPCLGEERVDRTDDGLWPARALAGIPIAAPAALAATAQAIATALGLNVVEVAALPAANLGMAVFGIPDARTVPLVVAALAADVRTLFAQPDFVYETHGQAAPAPSDPYERLFYGPAMIGADRLGSASDGGAGVTVAVLDTGIDVENEELDDRIAATQDFTGKGWSADIHGTQVAGIIAAKPGNGVGISGVAPGARILALKVCQPYSPQAVRAQCWSSAIAKGLDFAVRSAAQVLNLSVGGRREDTLLARTVEAAHAAGRLVVAAAGNDGPGGEPSFPAALEQALAVTAVDAWQRLYPHATQGGFVDIAAPGVEIISPAPGGRFPVCSGTSFATAFASGAAALILARKPDLPAAKLRSALEQSALDLGAAGKDPEFGAGLLDLCTAAAEALGDPDVCRGSP